MKKIFITFVIFLPFCFYFLIPFQWLPKDIKKYHYKIFGAPAYQAVESKVKPKPLNIEDKCPVDRKHWRQAATIDGVDIEESLDCIVDDPALIAAVVKGTNNIDKMTLMESGLTPDSVIKGKDLDGDGDPDEINIHLEVIELNGSSPDLAGEIDSYDIAPSIRPSMWVFAPKSFGMSTENFESLKANRLLRAPSPAIRVEQGDHVTITLENSHYMPHTIHFHGVDHPFVNSKGEGNDGVPQTSEIPVMPGMSRTYELQPRQTGTMFYHCHVQPQVHIMMGLQGMFIVEENRPNNWLETINVGDGQVRHRSVSSKEKYDSEYDLHYEAIDKDLSERVKESNDVRKTTQSMIRDYDVTDSHNDYYLLNGKSFPYTAQESIIIVDPNQKVKLRILNGSDEGIAIHTHGHKFTQTHADGVEIQKTAQITRDVGWIAPAQRADYLLQTTNDGLHSYGEGIWLMHDHTEKTITTDGLAPGGSATAIVYKKYLSEGGFPLALGVDWDKFFIADYYNRNAPAIQGYDKDKYFTEVLKPSRLPLRITFMIVVCILWLFSITQVIRK